jgi:hypothetical protein
MKTIVAVVTLKTACIHFTAKHVQIIANYNARIAVESNFNLTESKRIMSVKFATRTKEIRKEPPLTVLYHLWGEVSMCGYLPHIINCLFEDLHCKPFSPSNRTGHKGAREHCTWNVANARLA